MSMSDNGWMPFYGDDFIGSTDGLTGAESWAHMAWLWQAYKRDGRLPNNPALLQRWGRVDRRHWPQVRDAVLPRWTLSKCGTYYTHDRLTKEVDKARTRAARSRSNGKLGGRPKAQPELPLGTNGGHHNGGHHNGAVTDEKKPNKINTSPNPAGSTSHISHLTEESNDSSNSLLASQGRTADGDGRYSISPELQSDPLLRDACEAILNASIGTASDTQDAVAGALQKSGFAVTYEVPVPDRGDGRPGRLDLVACKGTEMVAIEIDRFSVRQKSIRKLQSYPARRVAVLRQGTGCECPSHLDALVVLSTKEKGGWPPDAFEQFLQAFEHRVHLGGHNGAKAHFMTAMSKIAGTMPFEDFLAAARRHHETEATTNRMKPGTWLAEERWNDSPAPPPDRPSSPLTRQIVDHFTRKNGAADHDRPSAPLRLIPPRKPA